MPSSIQVHRLTTTPVTAAGSNTAVTNKTHKQILSQPTTTNHTLLPHYHSHTVGPNQCCSYVVQSIKAPISTVWSLVRRFDNPQAYKNFVKSCNLLVGDGHVGTLREVYVVSGLPAVNSTERLEILDDENHVLSFSVIGGHHRLTNYRSVTTLHTTSCGSGTLVVESYVVDIPPGNTREETCSFVDTIVRCNLQSLAKIAQNMAAPGITDTSS